MSMEEKLDGEEDSKTSEAKKATVESKRAVSFPSV